MSANKPKRITRKKQPQPSEHSPARLDELGPEGGVTARRDPDVRVSLGECT